MASHTYKNKKIQTAVRKRKAASVAGRVLLVTPSVTRRDPIVRVAPYGGHPTMGPTSNYSVRGVGV